MRYSLLLILILGCSSPIVKYDPLTTDAILMPKWIREKIEEGSWAETYFVSDDYTCVAWGWSVGMDSLFKGKPYHQVYQLRPHIFYTNLFK